MSLINNPRPPRITPRCFPSYISGRSKFSQPDRSWTCFRGNYLQWCSTYKYSMDLKPQRVHNTMWLSAMLEQLCLYRYSEYHGTSYSSLLVGYTPDEDGHKLLDRSHQPAWHITVLPQGSIYFASRNAHDVFTEDVALQSVDDLYDYLYQRAFIS